MSQYFPPEIGAPQVRLAAVATALVGKGHAVEVVTGMPNHPTGRIFPEYRHRFYVHENWQGCRVHRVWLYAALGAGIYRMLNYLSFVITVCWPLSRVRKPDIVLVESPPPFYMVPVVFFNLFWRAKLVMNVADLWPDSVIEMGLMKKGLRTGILGVVERWSYRCADRVNAMTEGIRDSLIRCKAVPENKVLFFPNGVDVITFEPKEPDPLLAKELGLQHARVILYAGTLGYAQGLETALRAMVEVTPSLPDVCLVLIGDGSERAALEQLASELRLGNVRFLPPRPPEYVARLYSLALAGLATLKALPLFEGARPSKIFPIMACGKAVIYSGAGEGARLIAKAKAGVITPPGDVRALADAISSLANNPALAAICGRNGRDFVLRHLSWGRIIDEWLKQLGVVSPAFQEPA